MYRRWLSWKRLVVLSAEGIAVATHLIHHNPWITGSVVLGSLASIAWKARRDSEVDHWCQHGGYEISLSRTMYTFCDPTGKLAVMRKTQDLYAFQPNITSIDDGNIACTGEIGRVTVSPPGRVGTPELDGVHARYRTDLGEELPLRKNRERWIEVEYIDAYLEDIETVVVNVLYGTRKVEVILRFHRDRVPKKIEVRDRGRRGNQVLDKLLEDVFSDETERRLTLDQPGDGSKLVFKIFWT